MKASPINQTARRFVKAAVIAEMYDVTIPCVHLWAKRGVITSLRIAGTVRFDLEAVRAKIEGKEAQ